MNDDWLTDLERIARELRILAGRELDDEEHIEDEHGCGSEWLDDLSDLCAAIVNGDELPGEELHEPDAFVFALHSLECDNVGQFSTPVPNWSAGDTFTTFDGERFRIVGVVPFDDGQLDGMFRVEPVDDD